jgi:hypothetical protein
MVSYIGAAVALWVALNALIVLLLGPGFRALVDE